MTDLTPVAQLRAAASLMRARANSATDGPWTAMVLGSEGYLVLKASATVRDRGRHRVGSFGLKDWDGDKADAEYVASMDPLVALAVADWLDATAKDADEYLRLETPECGHDDHTFIACDYSGFQPPQEWGCDSCGQFMNGGGCTCWDNALAVARAYAGSADA